MRRALLPILLLCLALTGSTACADDAAPARPKRGRHLDLSLDRYAHDFGFAKQNSIQRATFTYTNTGSSTVTGIRARGECGCNTLKLSHETLGPGEQGKLEVTFDTFTLGGRMRKRVKLTSGDHRRGEVVVELDIRIQAGLVVRPAGVAFRDFKQAERPTKSFYLRWYEGKGKPFKITAAGVPGYEDTFALTAEPWRSEKDPKWRGWKVNVTLKKELPIGNFSAEVLVRTDHPDRKRITLPLNGNVMGRLWIQMRKFNFGTVTLPTPAGAQAKASSLKLKPTDEGVSLEGLKAVSKLGKVVVEVIPDPYMHKTLGMWKLIARVAPDAPAGSLEDEVIELHTGVPGEEIVRFTVGGEVRRTDTKKASAPGQADAPKQAADGR